MYFLLCLSGECQEDMSENCIYISKIDRSLSRDVYNGLLQLISKENQEKCRRFRFMEDSLRTLYGELIVRHVLCRKLSLKNGEIEMLKRGEGKPYIKDCPIHFNISHAGDFVVCAFSEQEVGVDIEQIRDFDLSVAKRYFCPCECEDLFAQNEEGQLDYFFSLWTLKESYMKWLGKGMSIPLDSFHFKISYDSISVTDVNRNLKPFFKQFHIDGYKLSLCSVVGDFPDKVEHFCIEEMTF